MLTSTNSSNHYLRPDYLTSSTNELDTKNSPLALLAQTCSAIGVDKPNPKLEKTTNQCNHQNKSNNNTSSSSSSSSSASSLLLDNTDKLSPNDCGNSNHSSTSTLSNGLNYPDEQQKISIQQCGSKSSFKPYDSTILRTRTSPPPPPPSFDISVTLTTTTPTTTTTSSSSSPILSSSSSSSANNTIPKIFHQKYSQPQLNGNERGECESNTSASPPMSTSPDNIYQTNVSRQNIIVNNDNNSSNNQNNIICKPKGISSSSAGQEKSSHHLASSSNQIKSSLKNSLETPYVKSFNPLNRSWRVNSLGLFTDCLPPTTSSSSSSSPMDMITGSAFMPSTSSPSASSSSASSSSSALSPSHALHQHPLHHTMLKASAAAAMGPYFNYSMSPNRIHRMSLNAGDPPPLEHSMLSFCPDPYCTACALNSSSSSSSSGLIPTSNKIGNGLNVHQHHHNHANGTNGGQQQLCPNDCTQCDHHSVSVAAAAAAAASKSYAYQLQENHSFAAYAHAHMSLITATRFPYTCNWMGAETPYCGKRFPTSNDLIQHIRTHHTNQLSTDSILNNAAAVAVANGHMPLTAHPLLRDTVYSLPSISPLSTQRYYPYSKPPSSSSSSSSSNLSQSAQQSSSSSSSIGGNGQLLQSPSSSSSLNNSTSLSSQHISLGGAPQYFSPY